MEAGSWTRLDNAANLWPAIMGHRYTTLFRLAIRFDHIIRADLIKEALEEVLPDFPVFQVHLRPGFFWNMLVKRNDFPPVERDVANPCMFQTIKKKNSWLFRVRVWNTQLAVEYSHALTDGMGAVEFLKILAERYLLRYRQGLEGRSGAIPPLVHHAEHSALWQDPAAQVATHKPPPLPPMEEAWHESHPLAEKGFYQIIHGFMSVDQVLPKAKDLGLTLTEYLGALLLDIYQDLALEDYESGVQRTLRPLRLLIPVNLRSVFQGRTLRNFFVFSDPTIEPRVGRHSFEEVCATVKYTLRRQSQPNYLLHRISSYVSEQSSLFRRIVPLVIKNMAIAAVYRFRGDTRYTSSLSNLGRFQLEGDLQDHVESITFTPPPNPVGKTNAALISTGNKLCVTFAAMHRNTELARRFFTRLTSAGVSIHIESNHEFEREDHRP